eukprot:gene1305-4408_t
MHRGASVSTASSHNRPTDLPTLPTGDSRCPPHHNVAATGYPPAALLTEECDALRNQVAALQREVAELIDERMERVRMDRACDVSPVTSKEEVDVLRERLASLQAASARDRAELVETVELETVEALTRQARDDGEDVAAARRDVERLRLRAATETVEQRAKELAREVEEQSRAHSVLPQ